jgi:hypothetical protein
MTRRLILLAGCCAVALPATVPLAEAASARRSGVAGRAVTLACPVTPGADLTCAGRGARAAIQVLHLPSKRRVATVQSSGTGWFSVDLPPGTYQVTGRMTTPLFSAAPVRVTVHAGKFAKVAITFVPRHPPPGSSVDS